MSKKKAGKKAQAHGDVIEQRVVLERAWAYARWLERMTWPMMRRAVVLPPSHGGLGYDLSPAALKGLVAQARADAGDLTMGREERLERQQVELDELARAVRKEIAEYVHQWGKVPEKAAKLLLDIGKREADLHGLAAPTQVQAEVVVHDGVTQELNAMLARAGRKPIKTPEG